MPTTRATERVADLVDKIDARIADMSVDDTESVNPDDFGIGVDFQDEYALLTEIFARDDMLLATPDELGPSQLESRANTESLDLLQHNRRVLMRELAPLAGLFEGGQEPLASARRKQHRHLTQNDLARTQRKPNGDVLAETTLERMANADPRHVKYCDLLLRARTRYNHLKVLVREIEERIRSREIELLAYSAELKLMPR